MEVFFPKNLKCISCEQHIAVNNKYSLCKSCYIKLTCHINVCTKCGRILGPTNVCFECDHEKYHFDAIFSALPYNDIFHHIIYKYKYGYNTYIADYLCEILIDKLNDLDLDFDCITFVPLGKNRKKNRGFNQAELLATNLGTKVKKPVYNILRRKKDTKFLAKLSGVQRAIEIKGIFEICEDCINVDFYKKKLLLIDDIYTSGATTNEISKEIKRKIGVEKVFVLTVANARVSR